MAGQLLAQFLSVDVCDLVRQERVQCPALPLFAAPALVWGAVLATKPTSRWRNRASTFGADRERNREQAFSAPSAATEDAPYELPVAPGPAG